MALAATCLACGWSGWTWDSPSRPQPTRFVELTNPTRINPTPLLANAMFGRLLRSGLATILHDRITITDASRRDERCGEKLHAATENERRSFVALGPSNTRRPRPRHKPWQRDPALEKIASADCESPGGGHSRPRDPIALACDGGKAPHRADAQPYGEERSEDEEKEKELIEAMGQRKGAMNAKWRRAQEIGEGWQSGRLEIFKKASSEDSG
jgi:hypothetical protein